MKSLAGNARQCDKIRNLIAYSDQLARTDRINNGSACFHMRQKVSAPIRFCADYQDGNLSSRQVLLVREALVDGQENIEAGSFRERKKVAVFLTGKSRLRHGNAIVIRQRALQFAGETFVQQDFHPNWLTRSDFAYSRAATAASFDTVGKSSRNSSRVWPPSK